MSTEMSMNTDQLQAIEDEAYRQYRELRALGYVPQAACLAASLTSRPDDASYPIYRYIRSVDRSVASYRKAAQDELEQEQELFGILYAKLAGIRRAMDEEIAP